MPLGDEEFYTLDGNVINREILVQHMIDLYNYKYPDTQITDFNEGSEIRNLLEAIAVDIFHLELNNQQLLRAAFLSTSYGNFLDLFGEELNTARYRGSSAWGTVTFSISEPLTYLITIPEGTVLVASNTGLYYQTSHVVEIPIGETSVDCGCFSQVIGAGTNAKAGTIDLFQDENTFREVSVTNANDFYGGRDDETDDDYRTRLLQVKAQDSFGSREYYNRLGLKIKGVHDIAIVNSTGNYTGKIIVNGNEKPLDPSILAEATEVYSNQGNLVYNHSFEVESVDYTTVNLEIECGVTDEMEDTWFTDILTAYFNGGEFSYYSKSGDFFKNYLGLNIDETLTNYRLLTLIETLPFVVQVTSLTRDGNVFSEITPDTNEVLKLGTVTITQEVVN